MLSKPKTRKKAQRIAISEIVIPIILLTALGSTVIVLCLKIANSDSMLNENEERTEVKWVNNLTLVMTYSSLDLLSAYLIYAGIKEESYWKCLFWVIIQIFALCLLGTGVVMRSSSGVMDGFQLFELIVLCLAIFLYKIHRVIFVAGLLKELKQLQNSTKKVIGPTRPKASNVEEPSCLTSTL